MMRYGTGKAWAAFLIRHWKSTLFIMISNLEENKRNQKKFLKLFQKEFKLWQYNIHLPDYCKLSVFV